MYVPSHARREIHFTKNAHVRAISRRTVLYNGRMMNTIATENIVIVALASLGVLVLLVMFVYVVRQVFSRKEE